MSVCLRQRACLELQNGARASEVHRVTGPPPPPGWSALKRRAKKVALAPDQSAHADRSEIVKRQGEFQRDDFQALQPNPGAGIGDIVNSASV
jgi:hypothetical protein